MIFDRKKQLKLPTKSVMIHPQIRMIEDNPDDCEYSYAVQAFEMLDVHIALEKTVEIPFEREGGQEVAAQTSGLFFVVSVWIIEECSNH